MKKKYESAELEIILLGASDVIVTSSQIIPPEEDNDNNPFNGSYDKGGWT
ncbi:MAG: hypothetical protein IJY23_07715 [Clostridia bacterium]|nr:hypothetical protein [Clostridia bacterium]